MRSPKQPAKLAMLLLWALLLLCNGVGNALGKTIHENSVDLHALLAFKQGVIDTQGALSSWNTTTTNFCRWNGVNCTTTRPFRVLRLVLPGQKLQGYPYGVSLGSALGPPVAGGTKGCYGFWMHTAPDGHSGYLVPGWLASY
ncbi:hypothetical protein ACQ4PT_043468 [Festuca glaucescens]